jgi:formylglycine-generating enzyme required for sulfatase activity
VSTLRFVSIPAGRVRMGSDPRAAYPPEPDETPRRVVSVPAFRISRAPVTNGEYRAFAGATVRQGRDDEPVTYVDAAEAEAYCRWAGGLLPSEEQWERAARGADDRWWPWGDRPPDATRANFGGTPGAPSRVGAFPDGASPFGVLDLAGNVWEWTASAYDEGRAVVRGGSYTHGPGAIRCSARHPMRPDVCDVYVGFRVAAPAAGDARQPLLGWADVPAGEVALGNDPIEPGGPALPDETPAHDVELAAFEIGAAPVTNAEYAPFAAASGRPEPAGSPDHPVTHVDWHDASAFCAWAGGRLPTEAEWERAARGPDGRRYPWGDEEPDDARAVFRRGTKDDATAAVGSLPAGTSAEGVHDLAGNVWEWTSSAYRPYPYCAADGREDPATAEPRVLRGGSFASPGALWLRCASRSHSHPTRRRGHIGFRVARGGDHA